MAAAAADIAAVSAAAAPADEGGVGELSEASGLGQLAMYGQRRQSSGLFDIAEPHGLHAQLDLVSETSSSKTLASTSDQSPRNGGVGAASPNAAQLTRQRSRLPKIGTSSREKLDTNERVSGVAAYYDNVVLPALEDDSTRASLAADLSSELTQVSEAAEESAKAEPVAETPAVVEVKVDRV